MLINETNAGVSGQASSASAGATQAGLGRDQFLKLLISQLENQSPLNPMDSTAFVAQLAQFSSLEQLTQVNEGLASISVGQAGMINNQAVGLVGRTVVYPGSEITVGDQDSAEFRYRLDAEATDVTINIKNATGETVRTVTMGAQTSGLQDFSWDLKDTNGNTVPKGKYSFEVSATGTEGNEIPVQHYGIGLVDGISFDNGFAELIIGKLRITMADIIEIQK
ncbi:MAG: flagellar hook capping protein [Myxococcales bacterium]|nr:flagellar hook capping protein [Myxococcales bacterium]|tara:strand:- start:432 stop:1097 length:666 start_codon:yes stop_codon:yes gene_type:complete